MLAKFFGFFGGKSDAVVRPSPALSGSKMLQSELPEFPLQVHLETRDGFPLLDWQAVNAWLAGIAPSRHAEAWTACERGWLMHFCSAQGGEFRLDENETAMIVSDLPPNVARAALEFMSRTLRRIHVVLKGIAQVPDAGKDLLIVFADPDTYYRYVSLFYPDTGEFALSAGMHINQGCSHFVTVGKDLHQVEPVIAHEMTHGCLSHLPIPAWVNEGLAVNVEKRLTGPGTSLHTPERMHERHAEFWTPQTIQEFWSGKSFLRTDQGNELSYDLARILVEQFSKDWDGFVRFCNAAQAEDGGAAAAVAALGADLGALVAALFRDADETGSEAWAPNPKKWEGVPERGAFT
jgi:hypothetical protein